MNNPDLLVPENQNTSRVAPLPKWKHRLEDGTLVESVKPIANVRGEVKYYYSTMPTASMYRPDGMRLAFLDGFLETDIIASQQYIEEEIENGCVYVSVATPDQVERFKMKRDPRGTITAQVEVEMRARLEGEIREKLMQDLAGDDSVKIAGVDNPADRLSTIRARLGETASVKDGGTTITLTGSVPHKLGGIVSTNDLAGGATGSTSGMTGVPGKGA